ncbi:MAG: hypothetical protein WA874_01945 [Chryseosolibacter sp.]
MKPTALLILVLHLSIPGQTQSTGNDVTHQHKKIVTRGNVSFATNNLVMTPLENEISDAEDRECKALLKRDTTALKNIWLRDFTLDEPNNELVNGKNPIPYYVFVTRLVEKCAATGSNVYTSGYELTQKLTPNGQLEAPVKNTFYHAWTNQSGTWKLSTRTRR